MKACSSTTEISSSFSRRSDQRLFMKRQEILDEAQEFVNNYFKSPSEQLSPSEMLKLKKSYNEEIHSNLLKEQRLLRLKRLHKNLSKGKDCSSSKATLKRLKSQIHKYQLLDREHSEDQQRLLYKKNLLETSKISQSIKVKNLIEHNQRFLTIQNPIKAAKIVAESSCMKARTAEIQKIRQISHIQETRSKSLGKLNSRHIRIKENIKKSSTKAANLAILSEDKREHLTKIREAVRQNIHSHVNNKQSVQLNLQLIQQFAADFDLLKKTLKSDRIDADQVLESWRDLVNTESGLQQRFIDLSVSNQHLVSQLDSLKQELEGIQASIELSPIIASVKSRMEALHTNAYALADKKLMKSSALENEVVTIKCSALFQIIIERCMRMLQLVKLNSGSHSQGLTRVIQEFGQSGIRRKTTLEDFEIMLMPRSKRQKALNHSGFDASSIRILLDSSLPQTIHGQPMSDFVVGNYFVMTFITKDTIQLYSNNAIDPAGTVKDLIYCAFDRANKKVQKLVGGLSRLLKIVRDAAAHANQHLRSADQKEASFHKQNSISSLEDSPVTKGQVNRVIKLIFHHLLQRKEKQKRLDNNTEESPDRPRFNISTFTVQAQDSRTNTGECLILKSSPKNKNLNVSHFAELPAISSNNFFRDYKTLQQHLDHVCKMKKAPSSRVGTAHSTSSSHSHKRRMNFKVSSPKLLNYK